MCATLWRTCAQGRLVAIVSVLPELSGLGLRPRSDKEPDVPGWLFQAALHWFPGPGAGVFEEHAPTAAVFMQQLPVPAAEGKTGAESKVAWADFKEWTEMPLIWLSDLEHGRVPDENKAVRYTAAGELSCCLALTLHGHEFEMPDEVVTGQRRLVQERSFLPLHPLGDFETLS